MTETRTAWTSTAVAAVAALSLIAFALRYAGAEGPLWLDELVSVDFVTGANGPRGLLTVHDNNHFLNTLWLAAVGAEAPARLQRALSIALGVLAVPLAAILMMPRGRLAGLAAAAVVALSTPLVVYGSEARGYAGLVACTLVLWIAADRHFIRPAPRLRWLAAAATVLGLAFQPLMAIGCVGVGLAVFLAEWRRGPGFGAALSGTLTFLAPSIGGAALLVAIVGSAASRNGVAFGGVVDFSAANFLLGYGKLVSAGLGLPPAAAAIGPLLAVAALAVAAIRPAFVSDLPLVVGGLVLGPLAFFLISPPNAEMARYHIGAGLAASLALVLAGRTLWLAGTAGKVAAALLAAAWFGATIAEDAAFLATGRGTPQPVLVAAADGLPAPVRVVSRRPLLTVYYLRAVSRAGGPSFDLSAADAACTTPPDLVFDWTGDRPAVPELSGPEAPCGARYARVGVTEAYWLSGMAFAVWRRLP